MLRITTILLFLTVSVICKLSGQHSNIDMCGIIKHSLDSKSSDSIDYLLQLDTSLVTDMEKAYLYSIRGRLMIELNKKELKRRARKIDPILQESNNDFTRAIEEVDSKNAKLIFVNKRFQMLKRYKPYYANYQSDLELLNKQGYKKDKTGFGFSIVTKFDGEFWLGGEFSLLSGYAPSYTIKDDDGSTIRRKGNSVSASSIVLGFARNLESNHSDYSFSLLRIEAPLFIDITKFGYIDADNGNNYWYYRPEIGVGYSLFHLSAGYNFFFKSEASESLSRGMINFRIKHTF